MQSAEELFQRLDRDRDGVVSYVELQEGMENLLKLRTKGTGFQDLVSGLDPERKMHVNREDFVQAFGFGSGYVSGAGSVTGSMVAVEEDKSALDPLSVTDRNALYAKIIRRFRDVPLDEVRKTFMLFSDPHQPGMIHVANLAKALRKYGDDWNMQEILSAITGRAVMYLAVDDAMALIHEALSHQKREGKLITNATHGATPSRMGSSSVLGSPHSSLGMNSPMAAPPFGTSVTMESPSRSSSVIGAVPSLSMPPSPGMSAAYVASPANSMLRDAAQIVLNNSGFVKQQARKLDRHGEGYVSRHNYRMALRRSGVQFEDEPMEALLNILVDGEGNIHYNQIDGRLQSL
jgi:Ca2+-binding EF-hand superfamily protein